MLKKIVCLNIFFVSALLVSFAYANPEGENVVAGGAQFDRSAPGVLNVTATPGKNIINWDSFSIAQNETVNFSNVNSPVLNRVVGADPSAINGTLTATGPIFLVNPNGIVFGAGSRVDVPALMASTLDISDNEFLHPQFNETTRKYEYKFVKVNGKDAYIINNGRIIANGGYVCLLSQAVQNQKEGVIIAELGTVVMAAGEKMTVSLDDFNQVSVVIDEAVQSNVFGFESAVKNSGSILANGGRVVLTASILNRVFDYAVNNDGFIQANALVSHEGVVELVAEGAPVINSGTISASTIAVRNKDSAFLNYGEVVARVGAGLLNSGNISIKAPDVLLNGVLDADKVVTIDAGTVSTTFDTDPLSNPQASALILANQVRISAQKFGSAGFPIKISADHTYINRPLGDIDILESSGIGSSIFVRGPPDGFGAIIYNSDTNLTLNTPAGRISLASDAALEANNLTLNSQTGILSLGTLGADQVLTLISDGPISSLGTLKAVQLIEKGAAFRLAGKVYLDYGSAENLDQAVDISGLWGTALFTDVGNIRVVDDLTLLQDTVFKAGFGGPGYGKFIVLDTKVIDGGGFDLKIYASDASKLRSISNVGKLIIDESQAGSNPTFTLYDNITTTDTQRYKVPIILGADSIILTASKVTFDATVDSTPVKRDLGIIGDVVFNGAAGATSKLRNLAVNGIARINGGLVQTTVDQAYTGAVVLGADTTLSGGTIAFGSTLNGGYNLIIDGAAAFGGRVGGANELASLQVNETTEIGANLVKTSGSQQYSKAVTLSHNTTLTSTGGSTITFDRTVNGSYGLIINGAAVFGGRVGGSTRLDNLLVNGTTNINNNLVKTAGTQEYNGAVTLGSDVILTSTTDNSITFDSTIDGAYGLTVNGSGIFGGQVGQSSALSSLLVNGTTRINTDKINTSGTQEYNGAVTLGANAMLYSTGLSTITFDSTIDGAYSLTTIGATTFGDNVGSANALTSLTVYGTSNINTSSIETTGIQKYDGAVTLGMDAALTGSSITFQHELDGAYNLTLNGATKFYGQVGATTALTSLLVNGATNIYTTSIKTTGTQEYNGAVELYGNNTALNGSIITFDSTVNGNYGLTVNGAAIFKGQVGNGIGLSNLTVYGTTNINTNLIKTTGIQKYDGAVTLGMDAALTGSSITFQHELDGAHNLTLNGETKFYGTLGASSALNSLLVNGATNIYTTSIKTTGTQEYNGAVELYGNNTALSGSTITFDSTVNGNYGLTVNGAAIFKGQVGNGIGLPNLTVYGTSNINTSSIETTGIQKYDGAVTLGMDAALTGSSITFQHELDGAYNLTLNGATKFYGQVGATTALTSLLVNGATNIYTTSIKTTGTQEYNGAVELYGNNTALNGSIITFDSTVNGNYGLTVNGAAIFKGQVGNGIGLSNLTVYGTTNINTNLIKTTGIQKYDGAVTLGMDAALTGSSITFQHELDGAHNLTLNGETKFYGTVGATTALTSLLVNGATNIYTTSIKTTGTQEYNGAVILGANATLTSTTGANITFDSTIDGAYGLTVNGSGIFGGRVGQTSALNSLLVNGATQVNTDRITTSGSQEYNGAVTLGADVTMSTTNNGSILFDNLIDGGWNLVLAAHGTGDITFGGAVGSATALNSLRINSANDVNFNADVTTTQDITQTTGTGTTTINNCLLSAGGNIDMENGAIIFQNNGWMRANNGLGQVSLTALTGGITGGSAIWDIIADKLIFSAAGAVGSAANPISTNINEIVSGVSTSGGIYIIERDGITFTSLTGGANIWLSTHGATLLKDITALNDIIIITTVGDITFSGTVTSTNAGADITASSGSILVVGSGPHLVTASDTYLSVPLGTIAVSGDALNVIVNNGRFLVLNIGGKVGLDSGYLVSAVLTADKVLFLPSSFPSPLYPPGNIYLNGIRIWPSSSAYLNSQANGSLLYDRYTIPTDFARFLINTFDTRLVFFYHPLTESTMGAFDALFLGADAYEFINGSLNLIGHEGLMPFFEDIEKKKKKDSQAPQA